VEGKRILILGGYGNTGRPLARLLLKESNARIVLAGRNMEKASEACDEMNRESDGERVSCARLDAFDLPAMRQAFKEVDFVVIASSTTPVAHLVIQAALESKIGCLDIQYSPWKISFLKAIQSSIEKSECCMITDGGFHPGLPAFMVRYAAQSFDQLETARVGSVIKEDWRRLELADSTIYELVEMMNDFDMSIYKAGMWKKASLVSSSDYLKMDFGAAFGKQTCAPMMLEEMRGLPETYPTLTDTGFYVGSFNWFTDWVIMPLAMMAMRIDPKAALKPSARCMHWGLRTFSKPPYGTLLQVEASGKKDSQPKVLTIKISHTDGYMFTAIPVAACLLQYLDGTIDKPGLWLQAWVVEPNRFMADMQRMGIRVEKMEASS
jgi:saccharopine dehydrogenase-like NADP-dependent oxidoreductase